MLTKEDFKKAIENKVTNYSHIAPLYNANDPRIMQHLDAIATMFSMMSAQMEVAMTEPFEKVRDSTVLADAAMRGIIPKATSARAKIKVVNKSNATISIDSGRVILDSEGREWITDTPLTLNKDNQIGYIEATEKHYIKITHEVKDTEPFYTINIPLEEDTYLHSISVSDNEGYFNYTNSYNNIEVGERVFHVEVDDREKIYVRFGYKNVVGVQPENGDKINLIIFYCSGDVRPEYESPFAFKYILNNNETFLELKMEGILLAGQNPITITTLRELSKYPSIYDSNAVFLGEFDFLIRRNFHTLKFLSVWNETIEESVRGPDVNNINCLFIAMLSEVGDEQVLNYDAEANTKLVEINNENLTTTQLAVKKTILKADNSYRIRFFTPIKYKIKVSINATISSSYIATAIKEQIIETILNNYGEHTLNSKRGRLKVNYQRIYALLKEHIDAFSTGDADFTLFVESNSKLDDLPEMWKFISPNSLNVVVKTANVTIPSWGVD